MKKYLILSIILLVFSTTPVVRADDSLSANVEKASKDVPGEFIKRADNFSQIAGRLKTRIEKMKALDIDTSVAEDLIDKAEDNIDNAKTKALKLKSNKEDTKTNTTEVKDALKKAYEQLNQALLDLKTKTNTS